MNFGYPYYYSFPTAFQAPKVGLLTRLFGSTGASIGSFINGTQKVLNIANQAIPLVRQIKPVAQNAKTMFKVMSEFRKTNKPKENIETNNEIIEVSNNEEIIEGPKFFI